jgi:phage gp46-like protein
MADEHFTDVAIQRDAEGVYDLVLDLENRDIATTGGFETALMCSLFSDRRAYADEVAEPFKRRGWIGNLVSSVPADNYGSGLWLYEQRRMSADVQASLRMEVIQSLDWMVDERLVVSVDAQLTFDPAKRTTTVSVQAVDKLGGVSVRSFEIWQRTGAGQIARNT